MTFIPEISEQRARFNRCRAFEDYLAIESDFYHYCRTGFTKDQQALLDRGMPEAWALSFSPTPERHPHRAEHANYMWDSAGFSADEPMPVVGVDKPWSFYGFLCRTYPDHYRLEDCAKDIEPEGYADYVRLREQCALLAELGVPGLWEAVAPPRATATEVRDLMLAWRDSFREWDLVSPAGKTPLGFEDYVAELAEFQQAVERPYSRYRFARHAS